MRLKRNKFRAQKPTMDSVGFHVYIEVGSLGCPAAQPHKQLGASTFAILKDLPRHSTATGGWRKRFATTSQITLKSEAPTNTLGHHWPETISPHHSSHLMYACKGGTMWEVQRYLSGYKTP